MWIITKQFDFCYGHRVWSQTLNCEFSLDSCLKCRHLHGHQGVINVSLSGEGLKDGMVTDFKHLNWFKKWLDDTLDHKFIMDVHDPLIVDGWFSELIKVKRDDNKQHSEVDIELFNIDEYGAMTIKQELYNSFTTHYQELYEGMIFVNFVPTSENLAKWMFDIVQRKMLELDVQVHRVEFFETPKSRSIYE